MYTSENDSAVYRETVFTIIRSKYHTNLHKQKPVDLHTTCQKQMRCFQSSLLQELKKKTQYNKKTKRLFSDPFKILEEN